MAIKKRTIFNIGFGLFLLLFLSIGWLFRYKEPEGPGPDDIPERKAQIHVVAKGEFLKKIAADYGVSWEEILLQNERFLKDKYEEVCDQFSKRYRNNPRRRGLFCNDRYNRPYGNTLIPGWTLVIPAGNAPEEIDKVVERISGKRIAIVIDDTGSMENDRRAVGQFYLAAMRKYRKNVVGVWLYADGEVRKYDGGSVKILQEVSQTVGSLENTHLALREAAKARPDTIVLVTDEPGDDWEWNKLKLPKVIAHCIPNEAGDCECEDNLKRLVVKVGGEYVAELQP